MDVNQDIVTGKNTDFWKVAKSVCYFYGWGDDPDGLRPNENSSFNYNVLETGYYHGGTSSAYQTNGSFHRTDSRSYLPFRHTYAFWDNRLVCQFSEVYIKQGYLKDPQNCWVEILGIVENANPVNSYTPRTPDQGHALVILNNTTTSYTLEAVRFRNFKILMIPENNNLVPLDAAPDPSRAPFVFVHSSAVSRYKTATNWSVIADKIYPMSAYTNWID